MYAWGNTTDDKPLPQISFRSRLNIRYVAEKYNLGLCGELWLSKTV